MIKLTKSRTFRPRKPSFFVARTIALCVTMAFAAFTVTQYGLSLWETDTRLAIFVGVVFALSALMTPCLVPILTRAKGFSLLGLLVVVVAFGALDSVGLSLAFTQFEKQATQSAFKKAQDELDEQRAPILAKIAQAEKDRDAVKLPQHDYTSRQEAALAAYNAQIAVYTTKIEEARADLAKLPTSAERPDMFDNGIVGMIAALIQLALAIVFGAIEATRNRLYNEALNEYEQRLEDQRNERARKERNKKRREKRPAAQIVRFEAV